MKYYCDVIKIESAIIFTASLRYFCFYNLPSQTPLTHSFISGHGALPQLQFPSSHTSPVAPFLLQGSGTHVSGSYRQMSK